VSCFFASFFRVLYFFVIQAKICVEGEPCIGIFFEPANVSMVTAALLTVMFWKKLNIMYGGSGVKLTNQRQHDIHFAIIIGFYVAFQTIMIVFQFITSFIAFEATYIFDLGLGVSAVYMIALLWGSAKYGTKIIKMVNGKNTIKKTKGEESKKLLNLLKVVLPFGIIYVLALASYIVFGMRNKIDTWMPMQFFFRGTEALLLRSFAVCLSKKQAPKEVAGGRTRSSILQSKSGVNRNFSKSQTPEQLKSQTPEQLEKINNVERLNSTLNNSKKVIGGIGGKKAHFVEKGEQQGNFV